MFASLKKRSKTLDNPAVTIIPKIRKICGLTVTIISSRFYNFQSGLWGKLLREEGIVQG